MPKKKRFDVKVEALLTKDLAEFLQEMVRAGHADSVSSAIRKCVAITKTYLKEENMVQSDRDPCKLEA